MGDGAVSRAASAGLWAYRLAQLGPLGWVGVALLVVAGGVLGVAVPDLRSSTQRLQAETTLQLRKSAAPADPALTDAGRLQQLREAWPARAQALDLIDGIHRAAAEHGVGLTQGEYRQVALGAEGAVQLQITLPALAPYPAWRSWLGQVMNEMPVATLEEVTLRRADIAEPRVEARVRLSMPLRSD